MQRRVQPTRSNDALLLTEDEFAKDDGQHVIVFDDHPHLPRRVPPLPGAPPSWPHAQFLNGDREIGANTTNTVRTKTSMFAFNSKDDDSGAIHAAWSVEGTGVADYFFDDPFSHPRNALSTFRPTALNVAAVALMSPRLWLFTSVGHGTPLHIDYTSTTMHVLRGRRVLIFADLDEMVEAGIVENNTDANITFVPQGWEAWLSMASFCFVVVKARQSVSFRYNLVHATYGLSELPISFAMSYAVVTQRSAAGLIRQIDKLKPGDITVAEYVHLQRLLDSNYQPPKHLVKKMFVYATSTKR